MSRQRQNWAHRYFENLHNYRLFVHLLSLALLVTGAFCASKLELKPSFSALLPQQLESVQHANKVSERFGGTGLLLIGIESPDFKANKTFADQLVSKLDALVGKKIKYYEYKFTEVTSFFEKYGLHYLKTSELFSLKKRLKREIQANKDKAFGSALGLDSFLGDDEAEDETPNKEISESDLLGEVDPRIRRFLSYPDNYLATDDGKLVAIGLQAMNSSLSLKEAQSLVREVESMVASLNPQNFHPQMTVNFAGNVKRSIEEVDTIKKDILNTALLLLTLILATLWLFLWSFRCLALVVGCLLFSVILTFGFTQLSVGYLNTMTAFLSSLVAGTGINYSIILLASSTTAASFISLIVADNKGFSQFGIIGGVGVLICWLSSFSILPLWIEVLERRWPIPEKEHPLSKHLSLLGNKVSQRILRRAPLIASILLIFTAAGSIGFKTLYDAPLEYDFSKLQNKKSQDSTGASALHWRIQNEVYKSSLVPAVVLLENDAQARELCPTARSIVSKLDENEKVFEACLTLYDLLPPPPVSEEEAKVRRQLRNDIKALMGDRWIKFSNSSLAQSMMRIHQNASEKRPTLEDIPEQLTRRFVEKSGEMGLIGFIYPDNSKPLEDGRNLLNYTKTFRKIWLPKTESVVAAAGEHFILADLLRGISIDGPKASLLAFSLVMALAFVLTGSFKSGALMATCMLFGTWWLLCLQGIFEIKYNFLNFIALPLTFGIGIDYPINIFLRFRELKYREFGKVITTTGTAVLLCSLTTIIGYSTLLGASNQALVSFAKLALLGEISSITSAMILLPVLIRLVYAPRRLKY
jgi:predicted RND superfamily exporter protein